VYCQLESIRQCVKLSALRKALLSFPKTLDETYNRILEGLELNGQLPDAVRALRWLCYASRPFQLSEMVDILAIETGDRGGFFPEERLPDPEDIMAVCCSLISLYPINDEEDNYYEEGNYYEEDNYYEEGNNDSRNRPNQKFRRIQIQLAHFSVKEFLLSSRCTFGLNMGPRSATSRLRKVVCITCYTFFRTRL
jgi:hypothetical protein